MIENRYKEKGTYRFEDFFWTGSGDGPDVDNHPFIPKTQIDGDQYYKTKTIITTVYIESPISTFNEVRICRIIIKFHYNLFGNSPNKIIHADKQIFFSFVMGM